LRRRSSGRSSKEQPIRYSPVFSQDPLAIQAAADMPLDGLEFTWLQRFEGIGRKVFARWML
jgi:hypothetical protein